jgi:peptidyl-prolyl cis-trans isomerase SurA
MKIILTLVFLLSSIYAKIIDEIAIIVNDIPITTYDINKMTQKTHDLNIAITNLINDALITSALKERNIYVDAFDVENKLAEIAKRNGMTLFDFKTMLMRKEELETFKAKIKKELEIAQLLSFYNKSVTRNDVKNYYKSHKNDFVIPKEITVTIYSSNNPKILKEIKTNPLLSNPNVQIQNTILNYKTTNPQLMMFLSKVQTQTFSEIIPINNNIFSLFYIEKKEGMMTLPFNIVASSIFTKLSNENEQKTMKMLLEKLKAKATIKFFKINNS